MLNNLLQFLANRGRAHRPGKYSDISGAKSVLPSEFQFSHDYCVFLHDVLTDIVVSGEQARLFDVSIQFSTAEEGAAFEKSHVEDVIGWLESNNYASHAQEVIYRQVLVALLSDFCHFTFEGLRSSSKGKVTVSYALLRKPLKETLLTFE